MRRTKISLENFKATEEFNLIQADNKSFSGKSINTYKFYKPRILLI